jgi:hypothetical protein
MTTEPAPSGAEILMICLDMVEAMALAAGGDVPTDASPRDAAIEAARPVLSELDAATIARVAVALADLALFSMPAKRDRASVLAWVERMRLEVTWATS